MHIVRKEELPSTQEYCINNYKEMSIPTAVIASAQTKGKGRANTNWISSDGSLTFSVLLSMKNHLVNTPIITSNIIRKILASYGVCDVLIKWPNDVYMMKGGAEYKVAGVLSNMIGKSDATIETSEYISILGVGINLNIPKKTGMSGYKSVEELSGIQIDKNEMFDRLLEEIERVFMQESAQNKEYSNWSNYFPYNYIMYNDKPCFILRIEDSLTIQEESGNTLCLSADEYSYNRQENRVHRKACI
ncbi:BirA family transcriptional regulator, biotin operon repressor / biotin---[acetyl-CoA-carboxylase] ligase [Nematocida minor]|uniref:BirA family transcriptional regulator, biotin operon repressor / biotin---[acetyl-CoA-carboxylase] ligase n=1 Tax=Nematocida minor TaxID=1912983 RepID=UPI0022206448|nr:BirA family transcriptional regulator, biotin operon repressor / biotin---[acetyl-CoA-carboxylase] ligase [Nematocida minor]KAI5192826.1 BirA family transcriptional regulator, biotin operon repressor / biotin---[acetyl-CoA-carboxylase] ligase [Nematocida minor]